MRRLAFITLLAIASPAPAETTLPRAPEALPPMTIALVQGEPDACGPGCSEWIAAEGVALPGSAIALNALLGRLHAEGKRPPVAIDSQGGLLDVGMAMGRLARQFGFDTIVARTERPAEGPPRLGVTGECHGACLYFFAGGVSRALAPGAVVTITAVDFVGPGGGVLPEARRALLIAGALARVRGFLTDMGLDPALAERLDGQHGPGFTPDWGDLVRYRIVTRDRRA